MKTTEEILNDVSAELARAQAKFGPMASLHEAYAVILEEMDELKAHVWTNQKRRQPDAIYAELIQLAAMVVRTAHDCGAQEFRK